MKSLFIASGLLAALSGVAAQQVTGIPELTAFKGVELDTDYTGQNMEAFTGSYADCIRRCFNNSVCEAVTLVVEEGVSTGCMLKLSALTSTKNTGVAGRETYVKTNAVTVNPPNTVAGALLAPTPYGYMAYTGMDYSGTNFQMNVAPAECLARCEAFTGCVGFTIDTTKSLSCNLKAATGTLSSSPGIQSYVRIREVSPATFTPIGYNVTRRTDLGITLYSLTGSLTKCERLCNVISGCQGWSVWTWDRPTCQIKKTGRFVVWNFIDSYWKNNNLGTLDAFNGVPVAGYDSRPGFNFLGNLLAELKTNYTDCFTQCNNHRMCRGITLDKISGKNCWLRFEASVGAPWAERDSYVKTTPFVDTVAIPSGYKAGLAYDFAGLNIGSKLDIPFADCAGRCNATTNCIAYVLDRTNPTNGCFLKSRLDQARVNPGVDTHFKIGSVPSWADLPSWKDPAILDFGSLALYKSWYLRYNNPTDTTYHGKVTFGLNGHGALEWTVFGYPARFTTPDPIPTGSSGTSCPQNVRIDQLFVRNDGQITMTTAGPSCHAGAIQSTTSSWYVTVRPHPTNPLTIQAIVTNNTSSWVFSSITLPSTLTMRAHALSFSHVGAMGMFPAPTAEENVNNVRIFAIDGLSDSTTDIANMISGKHDNADPNNYGFAADDFRHGTISVQLLKMDGSGMARQSRVGVELVKVTTEAGNWFTEKSVINGIRYAAEHTTTATKILAMPVAPNAYGWQRNIQCAIEMAYRANVAVFTAAGNENSHIRSASPFALTVGAVCGNSTSLTKCAVSNNGTLVDLWATGYPLTTAQSGTSISTIIVAAVAANLIQRSPTLIKNPGLLYNQIMTDTQTINNFKVARFSKTSTIVSTALPRIATAVSSCDAGATWNSLLAVAETMPIGKYVIADNTGAACNDWVTEEVTGGCT